jgi:nucleotide-binding universal stress UspA family protein
VGHYAKATRALVLPISVVERSNGSVLESERYLRGIVRELNYRGIPTKAMVKTGSPAEVITDTADRIGADLIAMTTRGGSKVTRWAVGGTAEKVHRLAPVPVLLTRSRTPLSKQGRIRRVFVPVDGSWLSEAILPWAEGLAHLHKAEIVFLHVLPISKSERAKAMGIYEFLNNRMSRTCHGLKEQGIRAEFRTGRGDPAEVLLTATEGGPNLIAMTTHGHSGFKRWFFGSVAEKVIHAATVPVFVLRATTAAKRRLDFAEMNFAAH